MTKTFIVFKIGRVETITNYHIGMVIGYLRNEFIGVGGAVCVVGIDHNVDVGIDIAKHRTNNVALALTRLFAHDCVVVCGNFGAMISRVIIIYVNCGIR